MSHYPLVYLYRKYLAFHLIDENNNFDLCSLVKYTLNDNCVENSTCQICQKQQSVTIKVTNQPTHFFVEVQQDRASKIKPVLKRCAITIDSCNYDLAGVIYYESNHFWTQHFICTNEEQPGYYFYNDLKYKGKAKFLSKSLKNLTPEKVHILIFEKANYSKIDGTASSLGEGQIIKTLIEKAHGKKIVRSTKPVKENIATLLNYADVSYNGDMKCNMIDAVMRNQKAIELAIDRGKIKGSSKMRRHMAVSDYPVMSDHAYVTVRQGMTALGNYSLGLRSPTTHHRSWVRLPVT